MVFNVKNTKGKKAKVYDQTGVEIRGVFKYNSRTREISMFMVGTLANGKSRVVTFPVKRNSTFPREVLKIKVKVPGSFIVINGKKY